MKVIRDCERFIMSWVKALFHELHEIMWPDYKGDF